MSGAQHNCALRGAFETLRTKSALSLACALTLTACVGPGLEPPSPGNAQRDSTPTAAPTAGSPDLGVVDGKSASGAGESSPTASPPVVTMSGNAGAPGTRAPSDTAASAAGASSPPPAPGATDGRLTADDAGVDDDAG